MDHWEGEVRFVADLSLLSAVDLWIVSSHHVVSESTASLPSLSGHRRCIGSVATAGMIAL